jgi:hypothetical protein
MLDEFFRIKLREKVYESVDILQGDFDLWLKFYNEQRPHMGYRNHGKTPLERINSFTKTVK